LELKDVKGAPFSGFLSSMNVLKVHETFIGLKAFGKAFVRREITVSTTTYLKGHDKVGFEIYKVGPASALPF